MLQAIAHYLPKLERCATFIETRRDPKNNLFLAGPAGNLLAPSYAGWKKPDGTYGKAYLAGLSITYIAALDRLIELEKLAGRADQARLYADRRDSARKGLPLLTTDEGYFIKLARSRRHAHGVYGAAKHGYFEASPNHDAIAFRVVDDAQAERIYAKIASIPGLRPHRFILPNYPSYDDMYEKPEGLWAFGTWVNGGHWSTCEARMILGYYRLGQYEDARAFDEAVPELRPAVSHGQSAGEIRQRCLPAGPADQSDLRCLWPARRVGPRAVRIPVPRRWPGTAVPRSAGDHSTGAALPHPLRREASSTSRRPGQGRSPACWSTASRGRVLTPRAFRCLMKISRK